MESNDKLSAINNYKTDYIIDPISNNPQSIQYGLYTKLSSYERHYVTIKAKYKNLTAAWMLATFLGLGYVLSGIEIGSPFDTLWTITLVGILSSLGILLIWFLDIGIYHRLLNSVFKEGLRLEEKGTLVHVRQNMIKTTLLKNKIDPVIYDGLFYATCSFILWTISDLAFSISIFPKLYIYSFYIGILIFLIIIGITYLLLRLTLRSSYEYLSKRK